MSKLTTARDVTHCLGERAAAAYNHPEFAASGSEALQVEVHGYWGDVITLYLRRELDFTATMRAAKANPDANPDAHEVSEWKVTMSHSSGGRDNAEVPCDLDAETNMGTALMWTAQLGRALLERRAEWEQRYQARRAARRAAEQAAREAKQAAIDADAPLGERRARALLDAAIATRKGAGASWDQRADMTITLEPRGGREHAAPRTLHIGLTRNDAALLRLNGASCTRAAALDALAAASARTQPAVAVG